MLVTVLAVCLGLLIALEVGLRLSFGFGNPLIYIGDASIGYLLAPNQWTRRNGNYIEINEYSMRGAPIQEMPTTSTLRVFLLGDSIANGGWWTDQKNTISSLIMQSLTSIHPTEVLNASANSWGPRNELAYLQKFGTFGASAIVLLINTDDLFATAPTSLPVGREKNYPDKKPPLALVEMYQRYIEKSKPIPELEKVRQEGGDRVGINLEAIAKIQDIATQNNSKFILAMTPLKRELGEPGSRDYEIKARARLNEFTKARLINYIDFLPLFNGCQDSETLYHDHIHLNLQGNKFVSEVIKQSLLQVCSTGVSPV